MEGWLLGLGLFAAVVGFVSSLLACTLCCCRPRLPLTLQHHKSVDAVTDSVTEDVRLFFGNTEDSSNAPKMRVGRSRSRSDSDSATERRRHFALSSHPQRLLSPPIAFPRTSPEPREIRLALMESYDEE